MLKKETDKEGPLAKVWNYFQFRKLDGSQKLLKDGDPWELMNLPIDYAIDLFNHVLRFINDNSGN